MARTGGDILVEALIEWGVDTIFGLPGDGINGIMEALRARKDKVRFVHVRHEESAAFMACGYAKFTGRLGVCLATSGPGAIHLLNGLYDAQTDHQPVLAIVGQQARTALAGHYQQEVDFISLFKDVAGEHSRWRRTRCKFATRSTAPSASPKPSAASPALSCRKICRRWMQ